MSYQTDLMNARLQALTAIDTASKAIKEMEKAARLGGWSEQEINALNQSCSFLTQVDANVRNVRSVPHSIDTTE